MPQRLHVVISGILAGGILGFRNVDCCFSDGNLFVWLVFAFQMACADNST